MSPVITKLLVANRGEIARRVMRTARAMGIATVAVYADPDAGSPHVAEADEAVGLSGAAAADTYLRADRLVAAARAAGADAVHPGYGFLAEDAGFARDCEAAGLVFVGPPPAVIEAMGSKLAAKAAMAAAGVPVLDQVEVEGPGDLAAAAGRLGWPVLVKASAGGGGRGMRVVSGPDDLAEALASARREARAAFGDDTVFLEPYVARPRHVEVQILGDAHGTVVHLFERECSIQRRHQKIVEECPSPAVDDELRARLGAAAVTAAGAIGYVGAGTVEFLLLDDGRFFFLEVNTRLQVEHPVTEAVTGLDLVRLQLLVAEGHPLPPEVRAATITGHAVEARLYAEDPTEQWRPSTGRLERFEVPAGTGAGVTVRVDSGVETGTVVSPHYDPLLAKVVAHAPTRTEAARALAGALRRARLHGLTTNRDLLVAVLGHDEFLAGATDTGFLDRHHPAVLGAPAADAAARRRHAAAAALAAQARRRAEARVLAGLPSGWRNNPDRPQQAAWDGPAGRLEVRYRFDRSGRLESLAVTDGEADGDDGSIGADDIAPDAVALSQGGVRRRYRVAEAGGRVYVDGPDGSSVLVPVARFPDAVAPLAAGTLVAPLPGTVVRVAVAVGDTVAEGDTLVAVEAMKMEHEIRAPRPGRVGAVHVAAGDQVEAGRVLAVVEEDQ